MKIYLKKQQVQLVYRFFNSSFLENLVQFIPDVSFTSIEGSLRDLNPIALHPYGKLLFQVI
jgi:hypothetical protein